MFANAILLSSFNNLSAIELLDLSLDLNISQQDFVNVTWKARARFPVAVIRAQVR
jgi:hypothetical protein